MKHLKVTVDQGDCDSAMQRADWYGELFDRLGFLLMAEDKSHAMDSHP